MLRTGEPALLFYSCPTHTHTHHHRDCRIVILACWTCWGWSQRFGPFDFLFAGLLPNTTTLLIC